MFPLNHLKGEKIAIFGLARSGMSLARSAAAGGVEAVLYDGNEEAMKRARSEGFETRDLMADDGFDGIDKLIVSPGIPHLYPNMNPVIARAIKCGVAIDNDISLLFGEIAHHKSGKTPPRVIAITGSNGKSTTSALIHHCLGELGYETHLGGNIGRGVFDLAPPSPGAVYVLELSSYQTELALNLSPDIAVFTNLSPDHLDRHGGMGGYFAAKARLFTGTLPASIIGIDEAEGAFLAAHLAGLGADVSRVHIAGGENKADDEMPKDSEISVTSGVLSEGSGAQGFHFDLRQLASLPGAHNWQNAAAAFGALRALGVEAAKIMSAMQSFGGLAHRCQLLGEARGVRIVNDSKATNADAARHALGAFDNILWIAGGRAKEGGIESLRPFFPRIKRAYLIGEAAEDFAKTLGATPHLLAGDLEIAMKAARADCAPGDVVLLSPACASFDQYPDFEKRGEAMISLAKSLFDL